jgi:hypothetical protein
MGRAVAFWADCGIVCSARQTRPSAYAVPRLSRFRGGDTRFTLTDGDENAMIVTERG